MVRLWAIRLFGLTALVATGSFWSQVTGLHGARGLMPVSEFLKALSQSGYSPFEVPSLLWVSSSNAALHAVCGLATISSLLVIAGVYCRGALIALWVSWLSLVSVCTPFLNFQWDVLLIEASFFFIFYSGAHAPLTAVPRFLIAWLACKVTFESFMVKVLGGDPSWRELTAISYHWWTQPLPAWTSYVGNALPMAAQKALCAVSLALELFAPLCALGSFKIRRVGALGLIALQLSLFAAGNYSYYNVLAGVIAVPLLEKPAASEKPGRPWQLGLTALVIAAGFAAYVHVLPGWVSRFETINSYGAFAHMTKTRPEIIVEGSNDGTTWVPYDFFWKPGRLDVRPKWVAPLQPRLDWQMWFAALGSCEQNSFVLNLQRHLLLGTPDVLALMPEPPFSSPPRFVRTMRYQYRFAALSEPGVWWSRELQGPYCPAVTLSSDQQLQRALQAQ